MGGKKPQSFVRVVRKSLSFDTRLIQCGCDGKLDANSTVSTRSDDEIIIEVFKQCVQCSTICHITQSLDFWCIFAHVYTVNCERAFSLWNAFAVLSHILVICNCIGFGRQSQIHYVILGSTSQNEKYICCVLVLWGG